MTATLLGRCTWDPPNHSTAGTQLLSCPYSTGNDPHTGSWLIPAPGAPTTPSLSPPSVCCLYTTVPATHTSATPAGSHGQTSSPQPGSGLDWSPRTARTHSQPLPHCTPSRGGPSRAGSHGLSSPWPPPGTIMRSLVTGEPQGLVPVVLGSAGLAWGVSCSVLA